MTRRWLSRSRLKREPSAAALAPVLLPSDPEARTGVAHRLLWSLFADSHERRRDFFCGARRAAAASGRVAPPS